MAIEPSAVSKVSYGTMFGCAFPRRPGATPVVNAFWAWLTRLAMVAPRSEMSTRWPPAARTDRLGCMAAIGVKAAMRGRAISRTATSGSPATDHSREHADRGEHPRDHVGDRDTDLGRAASLVVGRARDRHQPARGLDHEVIAGPVGSRTGPPVSGDGQMDEARVQRRQRLVVEAKAREPAHPSVLDEDVRAGQEAAQDGLPVRRSEGRAACRACSD